MEHMITRVDTTEDIVTVAKLAAEIWHEYYIAIISIEQIDYMVDKYQSARAITKQIHQQGYEYYFIHSPDTTIVGYMSIKEEDEKLLLSKFYINKAHRGHGYASEAIAFLEELCRERHIGQIWLTVNRHNTASIAVYEKKGFKIVREEVADIGNDFVMDDYIMEKEIKF